MRYFPAGSGIDHAPLDVDAMLALVKDYWTAVKHVFPEAWAQPPRRSRLMHGVGIISLGFVMDAIVDRYSRAEVPAVKHFITDLGSLKDICKWTSGVWNLGYPCDDALKVP